MLLFNEAISRLRLTEIQLKGCKYTWSNKQQNPLLERLDWFFISSHWTTSYPNTFASSLSRDFSYHTPCVISISTSIPRPQVFRFENYWLEHYQFPSILQQGWTNQTTGTDRAKAIGAKFKNVRKIFRIWKAQLPNLAKVIQNTKDTIQLIDLIEEFRDLTLQEWNFRELIKAHLQNLLQQQKIYWQQRSSINWAKRGDKCTRFFHAKASVRNRINYISSLTDTNGQVATGPDDKAKIIWEAFKERMGDQSSVTCILIYPL